MYKAVRLHSGACGGGGRLFAAKHWARGLCLGLGRIECANCRMIWMHLSHGR